ncbi:MAG: thiamine phosphate synthase [Hyphomicrobiales bacterium]|nr:thiamine phosphate synthase [Hyphomicrobiales bacterium]
MRLPQPPLLLVTDRRQARAPLADVIAQALAAGCRWVSLREKDLPEHEQVALARRLTEMTSRAGACLSIHASAALAVAAGCDGVHLSAGADAAAARALVGRDKLVGISIHAAHEAAALDPAVADYAVVGPVFETASKPGYGPALAGGGLAEIVRATSLPIIGIGGIAAGNVAEVLAAGAQGIAVMGGAMRAVDVTAEMRALLDALACAQPRPR